MAGDPFQYGGGGGRYDLSAAHQEEIFAGTFRYKSLRVEQDGFIKSQPHRFGLGQNAVGIVAGDLGFRHHYIHMVTGEC